MHFQQMQENTNQSSLLGEPLNESMIYIPPTCSHQSYTHHGHKLHHQHHVDPQTIKASFFVSTKCLVTSKEINYISQFDLKGYSMIKKNVLKLNTVMEQLHVFKSRPHKRM
jgi:hypothetical protein